MLAEEGGRGPGSPQSEATLEQSLLPQGQDTIERYMYMYCSQHAAQERIRTNARRERACNSHRY